MPDRSEARVRIEQKRAEQQAAATGARRRRLLLQVGIAVAVVAVAAVVTLVLLPRGSGGGTGGSPAAAVTAQLADVPAATIDAVGAGSGAVSRPTRVTAPTLTTAGKPQVLYIGAEYCPYCAAERWALTQALSRFGTFSELRLTRSAGDDAYPDTRTLSYVTARYRSSTVAFTSREVQDRDHAALQSLTAAQTALLSRYDAPPYVPAADAGSIPFIDIGGRYLLSGSQTDPQLLAGHDWSSIAGAMRDPRSPIARAETAAANVLTAAICTTTDQAPTTVCHASGVQAAAASLGR